MIGKLLDGPRSVNTAACIAQVPADSAGDRSNDPDEALLNLDLVTNPSLDTSGGWVELARSAAGVQRSSYLVEKHNFSY